MGGQLKLLVRSTQDNRGDTLIEVVIATVIIGVVLFGAYSLGSKAFQLGQNARERNQATQLIQEQAEGLRALRDSAASWEVFRVQVPNPGTNYHVERQSNRWQIINSDDWNPQLANPELPGFYEVNIETLSKTTNRVSFKVNINWARFGGGPPELSELYYNLTNRKLTVPIE